MTGKTDACPELSKKPQVHAVVGVRICIKCMSDQKNEEARQIMCIA